MNTEIEEWRPVPSLPGVDASSLGKVRSRSGKLYSQWVNSSGYFACKIAKRERKVHRIVMEAFTGPSPLQVNHKNGVKTDNRLVNLEYCTPHENVQHAYDIGLGNNARALSSERYRRLHAEGRIDHCKGTDHRLAKLNPEAVREIRVSLLANIKLAARYGVSRAVIRDVKKHRTWKHVT